MKKFLTFLFLLSFLFSMLSGLTYAQTEEEIRTEIDRLKQEIELLEHKQELLGKDLSGVQVKSQTLQGEIAKLNGQMKYLENQIFLTGSKITKTGIEIGGVETHISITQEKINSQKNAISQTILFLNRQETEGLLTLLLKNNNISDFLRQEHYANSLNTNLLALIDDLGETKNELEVQKSDLEAKKGDLETLKQQQSSQKVSLGGTKSQKDGLLKTTKGQEAEYQKLLTEAEEFERQINLQIFKLEDQLRQAIDPNSLPLAHSGALAWPVQGRITQPYGCVETSFARRYYPDCNNGRGGFHNGLDVAAPYGTSLRAAEDGRVIAVGNARYAYGIWLAVEHNNGLVTVYTHMSVRALDVGQAVKRGDVVGNMGSTGLSTGSHIHFMVYAPKTFKTTPSSISGTLPYGATLNPQDYL